MKCEVKVKVKPIRCFHVKSRTLAGSRPARSDDRRALGRRHPAGAASPHTEASWANALGQCCRRDYLICYPPQEGGVVWEAKGGFWLPTFVMGRNRARRIDGRIGVTNRERETRGPKRPVGSPAERLSLAILLVCFVASSLVCRCFVPP